MNFKALTPRFFLAVTVIVIASFARILPHWPNVTPIAAMALFGGVYFNRKIIAFLIPLIALLLSDFIIGFHNTMWSVYAAFIITVGIGLIIRNKVNSKSIIIASLSSSVLFFIITNFAVWCTGMVGYPMNFSGLMLCYDAALPFFRNEILGTLGYNLVFFVSFYLLQANFRIFSKA